MKLSEAIDVWVRQRKSEGYSPNTLKSYRIEAQHLIKAMGDREMESITLQDLREYAAGEHCAHLKPTSLAHRVRIVKSLFTWATEEEYISKNPGLRLKEPKLPERLPKALTFDQLELLRDACQETREHALIEFLFASGCRISEAAGILLKDVDWDRRAVVVTGKGSKQREVYFGARANMWLKRYMDTRRDDCPHLFVSERHPIHEVSAHQLWYIVKAVAERAGMRADVWPHRLRHSLGTTLLNQGAELAAVQSILGHTKPETTLLYARLSGTVRQQAYQRSFTQ